MPTLPTQSAANAASAAANAAAITAANNDFIQTATILILNATPLGFFQVEPFVVPKMDMPTITTYFQGFGYTVKAPPCPGFGFIGGCDYQHGWPGPEIGWWDSWGSCNCNSPCRVEISWGP